MISIWILISIIGITSLVVGFPKFINGEWSGLFLAILGDLAFSIGICMTFWLCM